MSRQKEKKNEKRRACAYVTVMRQVGLNWAPTEVVVVGRSCFNGLISSVGVHQTWLRGGAHMITKGY